MLLKLIACNVFMREASICLARSPHRVDPEFLEVGEHVHPDKLRQSLQERIDAASSGPRPYDAILLLYGLCGNAGVGLLAGKTKVVIPRAHDCCTVLLGSRQKFQELFADNPSRPFSSIGYLERGDYYIRTDEGGAKVHYGDAYAEMVAQYGEENGKFIWESMHPAALEEKNSKVIFIDIPETSALGGLQRFTKKVGEDGKECERVEGSLSLIQKLVNGDWNPEDFLVVEPGQKTSGVYDWKEIIRAK